MQVLLKISSISDTCNESWIDWQSMALTGGVFIEKYLLGRSLAPEGLMQTLGYLAFDLVVLVIYLIDI